MKIVVLGAGGLLGRAVVRELEGGADEIAALPRAACDIADRGAVAAALSGAALVINAAAYTDVDGAETDEDAAYRANALGPEVVAREAERRGIALVHVSTDFVFDGAQDRPYDELDTPAPIGVYGRSKWAGEELAKAACRRLFLVRVQALYGEGGRNFASKIPALLLQNKPFRVDREREAQPTRVRTAARKIVAIARGEAFGTYHVSSRGRTTWAGFASFVADALGVAPSFEAVPTRDLATKATRPPRALFSHRLLELRGLGAMPSWEEDARDYLSTIERAR